MLPCASTLPRIAASAPIPLDHGTRTPSFRRIRELLDRGHDFVFGQSRSLHTDVYGFFFRRETGFGSIFLLLLTAALPPDGAGISLCYFRALTGLPCPGCGLTRSFSSIFHLHFAQALDYHPFGFVVLPLFGLIALQLFLPSGVRQRAESYVRANQNVARRAYLTLVYGFIGFGSLRFAWYAWLGLRAQ